MKATITADGCLRVEAQSEIELYALSKWFDGYSTENPCESTLCIETKELISRPEPPK